MQSLLNKRTDTACETAQELEIFVSVERIGRIVVGMIISEASVPLSDRDYSALRIYEALRQAVDHGRSNDDAWS